jgi:hypothetical protein
MTEMGESVFIGILGPGCAGDDQRHPEFDEAFQFVDLAGEPIAYVRYEILRRGRARTKGEADDKGRFPREKDDMRLGLSIFFIGIAHHSG